MTIGSIRLDTTVLVGVRAYGSIVTKNTGNGAAAQSTTSYYVNGQYVNSIAVPSLWSSSTYVGNLTFICQRAGTYNLTVIADAAKIVNETDENNNAASMIFTCTNQAAGKATFADTMVEISGSIYDNVMGLLGIPVQDYKP